MSIRKLGISDSPIPAVATLGNSEIIAQVGGQIVAPGGTLDHPWGLTPKASQATFMKKQGIKVPKRFSSINEGIAWLILEGAGSSAGLYLRSEHPDDGKINARSGILPSIEISYVTQLKKNNVPAFWHSEIGLIEDETQLIRALKEWMSNAMRNSQKSGYDSTHTSFSFWESISGDNYTVVGDKNVAGTYFIHPIAVGRNMNQDARRVTYDEADGLDKKLIDFYKKVQGTHRFGEAPIIEVQMKYLPPKETRGVWIEDEPYFLQALTTLPGEQSNWTLERGPEDGEYPAYFVRGVTSREGQVFDLEIMAPLSFATTSQLTGVTYDGYIVDTYGLNGDLSLQKMIENFFSRNPTQICVVGFDPESVTSRLQNGSTKEDAEKAFLEILTMHTGVSMVHKPMLSVVIPRGIFYTFIGIKRKFIQKDSQWIEYGKVRLKITSDGRKAYIKILPTEG